MTTNKLQDSLLDLDDIIEALREDELEWAGGDDEETIAKLQTVTEATHLAHKLKMALYEMRRQEETIYATY